MERIQFLSQVVGLITQFWAPKWIDQDPLISTETMNDMIIHSAEDLWKKYDTLIGERPQVTTAFFNPAQAAAFQKHN